MKDEYAALTRLDISQLKNSYQLFENQSNCQGEFFYHHYFSYYLFRGKDDSTRVLFYPVTLHEASEPSACDLFSLLMFIRTNFQDISVDQMIIPFGEKGTFAFLGCVNHMVTLVIDFFSKQTPANRSLVNVRLIDSLSFSVPLCNQSRDVYNMLKVFYLVVNFDREYLGHQSQFDNESCCYFTVKTIEQLLNIPVGMSIGVPRADTWFRTSHNWLTPSYRLKIKKTILSVFERTNLDEETIKMINDSIIEVD